MDTQKLLALMNTESGQLLSPRNLAGDRDALVTDYLSRGFDQAFWWTVGFTVVAALASFFLPGRRAPEVIQDAGTPSANLSAKPSGQKVGAPGPH